MATKAMRHAKILQIVGARQVRSQHELGRELRRGGIRVSQGTLSRDIREIGLLKSPAGYRAASQEPAVHGSEATLRHIVREFLLSADLTGSILVLKTPSGSANTVAEVLDSSGWRELLGTLAGDNTVLCVARSAREARKVIERLRHLLA
ncbi:MAG: arginine repressor [Acidobacteriota bacterium]